MVMGHVKRRTTLVHATAVTGQDQLATLRVCILVDGHDDVKSEWLNVVCICSMCESGILS